MDDVLQEVKNERIEQDKKWGGPEHDDKHSTGDFVELILDYTTSVTYMSIAKNDGLKRKRLIQVAALAVAAIESIDRKAGLQ